MGDRGCAILGASGHIGSFLTKHLENCVGFSRSGDIPFDLDCTPSSEFLDYIRFSSFDTWIICASATPRILRSDYQGVSVLDVAQRHFACLSTMLEQDGSNKPILWLSAGSLSYDRSATFKLRSEDTTYESYKSALEDLIWNSPLAQRSLVLRIGSCVDLDASTGIFARIRDRVLAGEQLTLRYSMAPFQTYYRKIDLVHVVELLRNREVSEAIMGKPILFGHKTQINFKDMVMKYLRESLQIKGVDQINWERASGQSYADVTTIDAIKI